MTNVLLFDFQSYMYRSQIKYDLLLRGESRAEAGVEARAGAEATLCQKI